MSMLGRHCLILLYAVIVTTVLGCGSFDLFLEGSLTGPKVVLNFDAQATQSFKGGQRMDFSWQLNDLNLRDQMLSVELSLDGGLSWSTASSRALHEKSSFFVLPEISTSKFRFKISYSDLGQIVLLYESADIKIDFGPPEVSLLTLNSGGVYAGGSTQNIAWNSVDQSFGTLPVRVYYSQDKASWTPIQGPQAPVGEVSWVVPNIDADRVWIKVAATDLHGYSSEAVSEVPFTVDSQNPTLVITEPQLGDIWNPLSENDIIYQAIDTNLNSTSLSVEISTDAGITYSIIKNNQTLGEKLRLKPVDLALISDSNSVRLRLSVADQAGHQVLAETDTFTLLRTTPQLTINQTGINYSNQDTFTWTGTCDLSGDMSNTNITVVGPLINTSVPCSGSAPSGTWTYTTPVFGTDEPRLFQFSQTNQFAVTTVKSSTWIRDTIRPTLSSLSINFGASTTITPFVKVTTTASENSGFPVKILLTEAATAGASCSDTNAVRYSQAQTTATHEFNLSMTDGEKKICGWAQDAAGNRSLMTLPSGDLNINSAKISFEAGSPPVIQEFLAVNPLNQGTIYSVGTPVSISWKVTDNEGLSAAPISLEYTTDGIVWKSIVKSFGSLSDGTTSYDGSYSGFTAPSDSFFMLRLVVTDMSGNKSMRVTSNTMNTGNWSIFAGNPDPGIGGSSKTISLPASGAPTLQSIAIHPITGEVFIAADVGIVSINLLTSTSKLIASASGIVNWGDSGLSESGGTYGDIKLRTYGLSMAFDSEGRLYVNTTLGDIYRSRIYQIDLVNRTSRLYAGGGVNSSPTSSLEALTELGPLAFDEDDSMYFTVPCTNTLPETKRRLYRLSQGESGQPGVFSLIAGNCAEAIPTNNVSALSSSFGYGISYGYLSLVVKDLGKTIYYNNYARPTYKIINGIHYDTAIPGTGPRGIVFDEKENALYVVHNNATYGFVQKWTSIGSAQTGGETQGGVAIPYGANGPTCSDDNILATSACPFMDTAITLNKNGVLLWLDGVRINSAGAYRLRYMDSAQKIQTLAGTKPFFGNGMNKSAMRSPSGLQGIYYKTTTEPGSMWTPGLYFADSTSLVFGRINPNGNVQVLWGNQATGDTNLIPDNTQVSDAMALGYRYTINGGIFTFDSNGLPWLRVSNRILSLGANGHILNRQTGSNTGVWHNAPVGGSAAATAVHPYGFYQNFAIKKDRYVFLMGGWNGTSVPNLNTDAPVIRIFDFGADVIKHVIGGPGGLSPAPDSLSSAEDLTSLNLSSVCVITRCSLQFMENDPAIETDDELYFSEGQKIRRIINPLNPGSQKLETLVSIPDILFPMAHPANAVSNIFVTPDRQRIFYIVSGSIYCHKLSAGASSWCNDSSLDYPSYLGSLPARPNQMTMKDNTTLLINNGKVILQFKLPAD